MGIIERERETYAYDGWNQTATLENCQTLRAANSQGEGNDAVVKVCVIWKDVNDK